MDFSFFIVDNKSGYKTKESWFSKNNPKEYINIINYCQKYLKSDSSFKEKIWFYFHGLTEKPKCQSCKTEVVFSERFDRGYNNFCSLECANNSGLLLEKQKSSNVKKWGVEFYTQHEDFISKQKETKKQKYGNENFVNVNKIKLTKKERYGDENFNNIDKIKNTSLNKWGVDNPSKSKIVVDKIIKKNQEKWGFNSPTQSPIIKEKLKSTILNKIKSKFNNNEFINYDFNLSQYKLCCQKCNQEYEIPMGLFNERKRFNHETCTYCNPVGISKFSQSEIEIVDFIKSIYKGDVQQNVRNIIKQEIDIFIPEFNLGIEFNGLYWHSELYKSSDYHLQKTKACNKKGIDLLHIFEDEWLYNRKIVESIIKNKLGLTSNKIFARKCLLKEISNQDSKNFLNHNHIQGGDCKNSVRLGLYYKDELVSLMTFSKGRIALGGNSEEWELVRFCNKNEFNVIGAASKLFKHFLKIYKPQTVISYSDIRLFGGGLYETLGFKKIRESKPNYWYVLENKRYHRFNFRKGKLVKQGFDLEQTEKEIMFNRGYRRIYDCGHIRWQFLNQ